MAKISLLIFSVYMAWREVSLFMPTIFPYLHLWANHRKGWKDIEGEQRSSLFVWEKPTSVGFPQIATNLWEIHYWNLPKWRSRTLLRLCVNFIPSHTASSQYVEPDSAEGIAIILDRHRESTVIVSIKSVVFPEHPPTFKRSQRYSQSNHHRRRSYWRNWQENSQEQNKG